MESQSRTLLVGWHSWQLEGDICILWGRGVWDGGVDCDII